MTTIDNPPSSRAGNLLEIKKKTIRINNQVYPLDKIARIQSTVWKPRRLRDAFRTLQVAFALAIVLAIIQAGQGPYTDTSGFTAGFVAIAIMTVIILLVIAGRQPKYVCALETSGTPYCFLYSSDPAQVDRLVEFLVEVIENPPAETIVRNISNFTTFVNGDQINQSGNASTGKVVHG